MAQWLPSEWWTYAPGDFLLFTPATYRRLFALYHAETWPARWLFAGLGLLLLATLRSHRERSARVAAGLLAGCWLWVAVAFHAHHYSTIHWAAGWFAAGFALQALLLLWTGLIGAGWQNPGDAPGSHRGAFAFVGGALVVYALVMHPVVGYLAGRRWTELEWFGATPDPTVLATLGVLLRSDRAAAILFVVPLLWCALSGVLLLAMASPEAAAMLAIGALTMVLVPWRAWRRRVDRKRSC